MTANSSPADERSPPSSLSCSAAATVLPAEMWSGLLLLLHGPAAIKRPRRYQAAPASFGNQSGPHLVGRWIKYSDGAIVLSSLPSCGHRSLRVVVAAFVQPLPLLSDRRQEAGRPLADDLLILLPSLVLTGGAVAEQIDETGISKIPQIVWAESESLIVPV